MLVDRYGRNVEPGDWIIRLDQNNEGRLYLVEGYPETNMVAVHEHVDEYDPKSRFKKTGRIVPKRLKQTIKMPNHVIWYPESLLPEIGPREQ